MDAYALDTPVATRPTSWARARVSVLNVELDGAEVDGRFDVSSVVAIDGIVDDALRGDLLELLGGGEEPHPDLGAGRLHRHDHGRCRTRRLRPSRRGARSLCADEPPPAAIVELQSRLAKLIAAANAEPVVVARQPEAALGGEVPPLAGNAPCAADAADAYSWHVDADHCSCRRRRGPTLWEYPNRAPGKPRFVSALSTSTLRGRPSGARRRASSTAAPATCSRCPWRPGVVLLDMDVSHSVTAPTAAAGERARYSLVCKLVLHPSGGEAAIADPNGVRPSIRFCRFA